MAAGVFEAARLGQALHLALQSLDEHARIGGDGTRRCSDVDRVILTALGAGARGSAARQLGEHAGGPVR